MATKPRKKVAKKTVKKTTRKPAKKAAAKKTTKRAYKRKPRAEAEMPQNGVGAGVASEDPRPAEEIDRRVPVEELEPFTTYGRLDMAITDGIQLARGQVTQATRRLLASVSSMASNKDMSQNRLLEAEHNVAIVEFEMALDDLEKVCRG